MRGIGKLALIVLIVGHFANSGAFAKCWIVPAELFHPAELPQRVHGKPFGFSGSGKTLAFFLKENDGRTRMVRLQKNRIEELFLSPPAGKSFDDPVWSLWEAGAAATVDNRKWFAVYLGTSLAFYEQKRYAKEVFPAFRDGEVLWSPHVFDLCRERKSDVIRGAFLSMSGEHEVWSVPDMNWDATLPEKTDKLHRQEGFAVPTKNRLWVVEVFSGNVYLFRGGKWAHVFSAEDEKWTKWSESQWKEEMAEELEKFKAAKIAEAEAMVLGDATRRERKKLFVEVKQSEPYFRRGFARGDELLLQLDVAQPEKALLWFREGEEAVCLSFKTILDKAATWQEELERWSDAVAVTDEAIWFKNPFGFVLLEELSLWLDQQEGKADNDANKAK